MLRNLIIRGYAFSLFLIVGDMTVLVDSVAITICETLRVPFKLVEFTSILATNLCCNTIKMSLRGLFRYLHQNSETYLVRDGRHVIIRWRRTDQVHAHAKEYLRAKIPSVACHHVRATRACQDLMDLKLLRCVENNEPKR